MESFQQDAILKCSHLECNDIWMCEMWAREEGTGIVSTNATGGRHWNCFDKCNRRKKVCSQTLSLLLGC
jgi:hypothetical protein